MKKNSLGIAVVLLAIAGFCYLEWYLQWAGRKAPKFILINETSDHRFDESIQVSIYSAFQRTGVQNAVVLLPPLAADTDLSDLSARLFKALDLGRLTHGKALLYIFVPSQKRLKIEVSYALEGVLPDVLVKRLERAAKTFTYSGKYQDFWAELINTLNITIAQSGEATHREDAVDHASEDWTYFSGGAGILSPDYDTSLATLENEIKKLPKQKSRFQPKVDLDGSIQQYLETLNRGIGDPQLPILSRGSRIFRMETPMTVGQLKRNCEMYIRALPYRVYRSGNLAMALFKEANPVLPIVLIRGGDGKWRVDEPKSWAYFHRFENSMEVFQKFPGHPFASQMPAIKGYGRDYFVYRGAAPARNFLKTDADFWTALRSLESQLKNQPSAENYFALGDFYFFEVYDLDRAKLNYEKGLALDPNRYDYLWRMQDLEVNLGLNTERLRNLQRLADHFKQDRELQKDNGYYQKALAFPAREWIRDSEIVDRILGSH